MKADTCSLVHCHSLRAHLGFSQGLFLYIQTVHEVCYYYYYEDIKNQPQSNPVQLLGEDLLHSCSMKGYRLISCSEIS